MKIYIKNEHKKNHGKKIRKISKGATPGLYGARIEWWRKDNKLIFEKIYIKLTYVVNFVDIDTF